MNYSMRLLPSAAILALLLIIPSIAFADTIEGNIELPDNCTVLDKNGASHTFPKENSPSKYLAVCALAKALEEEVISAMVLGEFTGFGLFVEGLNGIAPAADEFWALWLNGDFADCGIECLPLAQGDTVSFILTSFEGEERGESVVLHITSLVPTSQAAPGQSGQSGGGEYLEDKVFNVASALEFLVKKQNADGSFASPMLTDWAAIAFGVGNDNEVCNDACRAARERLRIYLRNASSSTSLATDLERHIMGLEALGIDPYTVSGAPVDALVSFFDGAQMGEKSLVNDDIFALFPLLHAGYAKNDSMIEAVVAFILSKQKPNGSWEESVDLTAAAIQALKLFGERAEAAAAVGKGKEYLKRNQDDSGIFGRSSFTLSWVLQAIASLGETPQDWKKSGVTPLGYLGVLQQDDGGVEPMSVSIDTRVWATSYAVPAAFGKPWDAILGHFSRPAPIPPPLSTTATFTTSPSQVSLSLPEERANTVVARSTTPEPPAIQASEPGTGTASDATTTATTTDQLASAAEATNGLSTNGLWLAGLALIFGATFYFLRRA
ncbi:hypothetical protein HY418_03380 [Candidatus Kaiserbacteria bacterium]|nr:hypothetical protein [Candidatus Kaiserbacteria bacterium]